MRVVVAGSRSGVGRTALIERLLQAFPGASAVKVTPEEGDAPPRVVSNAGVLAEPGSDTARYLAAGAGDVLWVRCRREEAPALLAQALGRVAPGLVFIESGTAAHGEEPDVLIFAEGPAPQDGRDPGSPRPGAADLRDRAHVVTALPFRNFDRIVDIVQETLVKKEEETRELIRDRQRDGKLSCAEIFRIAEETGVTRSRVGEIMNELEIKIVKCQLGCFP